MEWITGSTVIVMFLYPAGPPSENPWKDKVSGAVAEAERARTVAAYREALDVAWRADDWHAGFKLARAAREAHPNEPSLLGRIARAFWRAGRLADAEAIVDTIRADTRDRVSLTSLVEIQLARGRYGPAYAAARRLEELGPASAVEYYYVLAARLADDRMDGLAPMLRKATQLVDVANGYPEMYLEEVLDGLPEFFEAIGSEPVNQVTHCGEAEMPMITLMRLPYCNAMINGQGPYRLILDTGGSITLCLDDDVAHELGLKSYGTASIRGVSGKQDSEQMLVDKLELGEISCRRVMTRTFAMPAVLEFAAQGIIGCGVFARMRTAMDFEHARFVVSPSSDEPARGHSADLRIVGDAKLIAPIRLEGQPAISLLDSGADVAAVSMDSLRELFPDRELTTIAAGGVGVGEGEAAGISLAPGVTLELWGRTYENYSGLGLDVLDNLLSPILGIQTQVLIGMPVFRDMKSWTTDYPRRKMWVAWLE